MNEPNQSPRAGGGKLTLSERLGDMRHYLNEAHGFAAMSPRGRACIGIVLDLLDEAEPEVTVLAAAPAAAPAWQPIETAPKDGARLLLWWASEVQIGRYVDAGKSRDGGDWWISESRQVFKVGDGRPTHWMPLPTAPGIPAPATMAQAEGSQS